MSVLTAQERRAEDKAKALRREGLVPMALQEKGGGSRLLQAPEREVQKAIAHATGAGMLDLALEGQSKNQSVVLKKVDRDILTRHITHVTFMEVSQSDKIKVDIPIVAIGTPEPVSDGIGVLMHPVDHVSVRAKVSDIPDHLEVDISGLQIHGTITAGEIDLGKKLELMSSPDAVLFVVSVAQEEVPETEEVAGAETEEGGQTDTVDQESGGDATNE